MGIIEVARKLGFRGMFEVVMWSLTIGGIVSFLSLKIKNALGKPIMVIPDGNFVDLLEVVLFVVVLGWLVWRAFTYVGRRFNNEL